MLKGWMIVCTTLALAASAGLLTGCGQKGALTLPTQPEAADRARLPQTLNPWHRAHPAAPPASESKR
ncbi:MAG: LPS translocon maturation chaperone LptM [Limnohabitans sp.]